MPERAGDEVVREKPNQRVRLRPSEGQTAESIERDFEQSFAHVEAMAAEGTKEWTSHMRTWGRLRWMAYKEVGPPPWPWPKVGIQPSDDRHFVRLIVGWRSTAYALCLLWRRRG